MRTVLIYAPGEAAAPTAALVHALQAAGFSVSHAALEGSQKASTDLLCRLFAGRPPDLIVADLSAAPNTLPLRRARSLLADIWGDAVSPLCLALLTHSHLTQHDWPAYADDFLLPPYAAPEVLARISLLSFRRRHVQGGNRLSLAEMTLELDSGRVLDDAGNPLPLTPREYELLRFLLTHRGKFFSRDRLLDLVWGVDYEGGERTVDIHIRRLRAKLPPKAALLLETRHGVGYGITHSS